MSRLIQLVRILEWKDGKPSKTEVIPGKMLVGDNEKPREGYLFIKSKR